MNPRFCVYFAMLSSQLSYRKIKFPPILSVRSCSKQHCPARFTRADVLQVLDVSFLRRWFSMSPSSTEACNYPFEWRMCRFVSCLFRREEVTNKETEIKKIPRISFYLPEIWFIQMGNVATLFSLYFFKTGIVILVFMLEIWVSSRTACLAHGGFIVSV